jgi:Flp pilus assembly protein TadG
VLPLVPPPEDRGRLGAFHACSVGASSLRKVARDCSGAVAVEFVIISIPLLFLLTGGFDLGFAMLTETRINFAVVRSKLRRRRSGMEKDTSER